MIIRKYTFYILAIILSILTVATTFSQQKNNPNSKSKKIIAPKLLPNGDVQLGEFRLNRKEMSLSFPAEINLSVGVLEVLIATDVGRLHESLLWTKASPLQLQTMLYLLGLTNGLRVQKEKIPQGDILDIDLEWKNKTGKIIREPVENWIRDERTQKNMKRIGWVFVGSVFREGIFQAEVDGNLVVCYTVPDTVLDIPDSSAEDDTIYVANDKRKDTPIKTKVRVIITPRKKKLL